MAAVVPRDGHGVGGRQVQSLEAFMDVQRAFMDKYGDPLEQLLSVAVYMVPVQDESDDLTGFWSQVVYSVIDLFNLYRTVLLRSPNAVPVAVPSRGEGSRELQLTSLRRRYTAGAFCLRALRSVQVLLEMRALRQGGGAKGALLTCMKVEVLKLTLKLSLRTAMPFCFYVDEDALEEVEPPTKGRAGRGMHALGNAPPDGGSEVFVGQRSGRRLPPMGGRGGAVRPIGSLLESRTEATPMILAAEALHHGRPLVHLLMMLRRGQRSWAAWWVALIIDRLSYVLLASQVEAQRRPSESRASLLEMAEVRRRRGLIWWALARSPFFDKFFLRPSEFLDRVLKRIPIVNVFNVVELFLALRPFYFTTSGS
eukprot:gnl/TRDRNA2_/TRDRNA2_37058_c0_seq1.p1 gnl/TRDRNA2_/TRDRNA2_37058_c0~~gnl/TRDRNA2_/TRDRNA2_37058_c0_seq1.p1  ORF type:complete len:367 (+),score=64.19 gnl/TRDRNA2_/TRDRNA2_37058_c0_seq1:29-1129(+)